MKATKTNNVAGLSDHMVTAGEGAMSEESIPRRRFLVGAGAAGGAVAAALTPVLPQPAGAQAVPAAPAHPAPPDGEPRITLTGTEFDFIVAAVDTIIPADDLTPSGSDCGVAVFIDRQLASAWGGGSKMYRSGPFQKGKPEQGYQLPLTPREFFAAGIAAVNAWTRGKHGADFDRLTPQQRDEVLHALDQGKAELAAFDGRQFFEALLSISMEGFFADPVYGGNRDKVAWKMVGFPGLPATYANLMDEYRNKRYVAEPQSIVDFS
jgi:gluconate 2-dehydrogenase gamma chain